MQCKIVENYIHVHQKRDPNNKKRIQISEIYYKRNKADLKSEDHLRYFVICDSHYFTIDVSDAFKSFTLYVKWFESKLNVLKKNSPKFKYGKSKKQVGR